MLDQILSDLLSGTRTKEGTEELNKILKDPQSIAALFSTLGTSAVPEIRQYAALILKQRFMKRKRWNSLSTEIRNQIKQGCLSLLINEPIKSVKSSIAQFVAVILRHEFRTKTWPELFDFLTKLCSSENINERELGMFILGIFCEMSWQAFQPYALPLCNLFAETINKLDDLTLPLGYLTVSAMSHYAANITEEDEVINFYLNSLPRIMMMVRALAPVKPEKSLEVIQFLDDIVELVPGKIMPYLIPLLELSLGIIQDITVPEDIRIHATMLLDSLVRHKKKAIVKMNLVEQILKVLLEIMTRPPPEGEDPEKEEYFTEDENERSIFICANQSLDQLALHLPPEKLITPLMDFLKPAFAGSDVFQKRAAYVTIAVLAEGCSEYIQDHFLNDFVKIIIQGITSNEVIVRNAALFALGQYSEYLCSDLSMYAQELIPQLCSVLDVLSVIDPQIKDIETDAKVDRAFYALESFCENLQMAVVPFLPIVMEKILMPLERNLANHYKELSFSAIGCVASAVEGELLPYFQKIMDHLTVYILKPKSEQSEHEDRLQIQAIETLSIIARALGPQHFFPMSSKCLALGLNFIESSDDPDIKKVVYTLFGSLSTVVKEEMGVYLNVIMKSILSSLWSEEGIITQCDKDNIFLPLDDDEDENEEDEEDIDAMSEESDDSSTGYVVENSYVEEKEAACSAIKDFAEHIGAPFLPYVNDSFAAIIRMVDFNQEDVRCTALETITQLCVLVHESNQIEYQPVLMEMLKAVVPQLADIIKTDEERAVVTAALDAFGTLLKKVGSIVIQGEGHLEQIVASVRDVLNKETACQDTIEVTEEDEAEYDEKVLEVATDIYPGLAKILPNELFAQYFSNVLPVAINKTKKDYSHAVRASSIGMISECLCGLSSSMSTFVPKLLPLLINAAHDKNHLVRNNAIFGLGELVLHGKECVFPYYTEILQTLSNIVSVEHHGGVLDNICGAIARLIISNSSGIPIEQVLPTLMKKLPLREDFEENKWVCRSLLHLYQMGDSTLSSQIESVIYVCLEIARKKEHHDNETLQIIVTLVKAAAKDFQNACENVLKSNEHFKETFESILKL